MKLNFAVTKSGKISSPPRIRRVGDDVKVGDKLDGQKVVQIFSHEPKKLSRFSRDNAKSDRGNKELAMLVAMMDFSNSMTPASRTELERLLTSAFLAGMQAGS